MKCSLVWFRRDLRVHDHGPLLSAAASGFPVVGVYCFDPREYGMNEFGFSKTGIHRAQFLLESVAELRRNMNKLGFKLIVRMGKPEVILSQLISNLEIQEIHYHIELGSEETTVEQFVRSMNTGCTFHGYYGHSLIHPEDLPFTVERLPDLYTPFQKQILQSEPGYIRKLLPLPMKGSSFVDVEEGRIPTEAELGLSAIPTNKSLASGISLIRGGSAEGRKRLRYYFYEGNFLQQYQDTRNGLLQRDDSSKLSPYLALGCLSPRYVYWSLMDYEAERGVHSSTKMFKSELLWRDFFWYVHMKYGNRIFAQSRLSGTSFQGTTDSNLIQAWMNGETGYPIVDANMRELRATGWMSNRGRQITSSFLAKNLGIDWRVGAAWFESCLLDYDVSVNYGNWCYTSGVGNDSMPYRLFNVTKQGKEYDSNGRYAKHWLPELKSVPSERIYDVPTFSLFEQLEYGLMLGEHYPYPIIDWSESVQRYRQRTN
ncbi:DASH family cryptochrome [Paenibacillus sp. EC2-1]|uniref:DASH family cryptochrome n=1 Tax=Paenibacillus sp. EC2-1 TaxID=3388665 RepID=UPI003BEEDFAA